MEGPTDCFGLFVQQLSLLIQSHFLLPQPLVSLVRVLSSRLCCIRIAY